MKCVRPKVIPKPGLVARPSKRVPGFREFARDTLVVPCGKCSGCRKDRQDGFAVRIRAEADKKGSVSFLTLTYEDSALPLVSTLWRVSKDTGEMERVTDPDFVCYSRKDDFFSYRKDFRSIVPSRFPRYIDVPFDVEDDDYTYIMRITPSVCRKDVQLWLKSCRNFCTKVSDNSSWSYAVCSEYGPRTCRPHYHVLLFGLTQERVEDFARLWRYGFTDVKHVNRVNPDKSDGFTRVAEYVGKYVSKGKFECESVSCGAACGTRMMTSKKLGSALIEKVRDYVCAFDMIGVRYDLDTFWCPDKMRYLRRDELQLLCLEIPKRLSVTYDGKRYFALPRLIRNKIFYVEKKSESGNVTYSRPSKLWKMVVDSIQRQYVELHRQEFEQFLSGFSPGKIREAVSTFNLMQEGIASVADVARDKVFQRKLSQSQF